MGGALRARGRVRALYMTEQGVTAVRLALFGIALPERCHPLHGQTKGMVRMKAYMLSPPVSSSVASHGTPSVALLHIAPHVTPHMTISTIGREGKGLIWSVWALSEWFGTAADPI